MANRLQDQDMMDKNEIYYIIKVEAKMKKFNFDQIFARTLCKQRNFNSFVFFRLNVLFFSEEQEWKMMKIPLDFSSSFFVFLLAFFSFFS